MSYPGYHPFGPPTAAPAPMPSYGYAPPPGAGGTDSRFVPLLIGWLAAFLMPVVYCGMRVGFYGKDWIGIFLVAVLVGPVFFGVQAMLNLISLGIPKRCNDTLLVYWGGVFTWWAGVAAFCVYPGWKDRERIREIGDKAWLTEYSDGSTTRITAADKHDYGEIFDFWLSGEGNLQEAITVPSLIALAGVVLVIGGVIMAAQNPARPVVAHAPSWPGRPY